MICRGVEANVEAAKITTSKLRIDPSCLLHPGKSRQLSECLQNSENNILHIKYPFLLTYRIA